MVVSMTERDGAPHPLEQVRAFLNTWELPNDTRIPVDSLAQLATDPVAWRHALPDVVPPPAADAAVVRGLQGLRDDVRSALGTERPTRLEPRLARLRWRAHLGGADDAPVALTGDPSTTETSLLALVLHAVAAGTWHRLRACPDCGWVFYDSSRNARRTWCSMGAEDGARGCGSIAKTRAYRARRRASGPIR
jgi:predicted RNA-binding Zn ribbon-like protein